MHLVLHLFMATESDPAWRVFKTSGFLRAAKKAHIPDVELCRAIREVIMGQADNLGGGVFKKRLGKNLYRSIIVAQGRQYWVYEYLFAKKDRANIEDDELAGFRKLAKAYAALTAQQVSRLLANRAWMEICHEDQA